MNISRCLYTISQRISICQSRLVHLGFKKRMFSFKSIKSGSCPSNPPTLKKLVRTSHRSSTSPPCPVLLPAASGVAFEVFALAATRFFFMASGWMVNGKWYDRKHFFGSASGNVTKKPRDYGNENHRNLEMFASHDTNRCWDFQVVVLLLKKYLLKQVKGVWTNS